MNEKSEINGTEPITRSIHRYWRESDSSKPWFPVGLLHLLWLALLFLVGALLIAPDIEADVRAQVSDRLQNAGVGSATVSADGQIVSIRADANGTSEAALQTIANSTRCSTWAGNFPCPTTVSVSLDAADSAPAKLELRPHEFMIERRDDAVTLYGEVPNLDEQERILDIADRYFENVNNELAVTNQLPTESYSNGIVGAITTASHLQQGHVKWSGQSLSVLGFASAEGAALARNSFNGAGSNLPLGSFNVRALDAPVQCNRQIGELLAGTSIRFETGSAELDAGNEPIFEQIAELSDTCPGQLRIEGHTDNQGDADMNKTLSASRANSVREALEGLGIESNRLIAIGYGEERPVADNSTASGRAANRRIAIIVQEN